MEEPEAPRSTLTGSKDSLYNPVYGYFSSQATIFDPGEPFEFTSMASGAEFDQAVQRRYTAWMRPI